MTTKKLERLLLAAVFFCAVFRVISTNKVNFVCEKFGIFVYEIGVVAIYGYLLNVCDGLFCRQLRCRQKIYTCALFCYKNSQKGQNTEEICTANE